MDNILFVEILSNVNLIPAVEQLTLLTLGVAVLVGVGLLASVLGALVEVITWKQAKEPAYQAGKRKINVKAMKVAKMKVAHRQRVQMAFDPREIEVGEDFWPEVVDSEVVWLEKETEMIKVPVAKVQPVQRPINLWIARINTAILTEELMAWADVPTERPSPVLLT